MKPKTSVILQEAIEAGIEYGYARAYKHTDTPSVEHITTTILDAVMAEIHQRFDFEDSNDR